MISVPPLFQENKDTSGSHIYTDHPFCMDYYPGKYLQTPNEMPWASYVTVTILLPWLCFVD